MIYMWSVWGSGGLVVRGYTTIEKQSPDLNPVFIWVFSYIKVAPTYCVGTEGDSFLHIFDKGLVFENLRSESSPSLLFDRSPLPLLLLLPECKPSSSPWGALSGASYLALWFNIAHSQSIHYSASDFFLKWKYYPIMLPVTYEIKSIPRPCHTKTSWCEPDDHWQQRFLLPFHPKFWNSKVTCWSVPCLRSVSMSLPLLSWTGVRFHT